MKRGWKGWIWDDKSSKCCCCLAAGLHRGIHKEMSGIRKPIASIRKVIYISCREGVIIAQMRSFFSLIRALGSRTFYLIRVMLFAACRFFFFLVRRQRTEIFSFSAEETVVLGKNAVQLKWDCRHAILVQVEGAGFFSENKGVLTVQPGNSRVYVLRAVEALSTVIRRIHLRHIDVSLTGKPGRSHIIPRARPEINEAITRKRFLLSSARYKCNVLKCKTAFSGVEMRLIFKQPRVVFSQSNERDKPVL